MALPEAVQQEVLSWYPTSASANALLETCTALHRLRRAPAAAALLLLRCPCQDHTAALASCSICRGGPSAVADHVLQLLQAGPERGGPHSARPALLQALLYASAAAGDGCGRVRALMALPQPPDVDADDGRALHAALMRGPHLRAMEALLECGADPIAGHLRLIVLAAARLWRAPAVILLLDACPECGTDDGTAVDMVVALSAAHNGNFAMLEAMATGFEYPREGPLAPYLMTQVLLDSRCISLPADLASCLCAAACGGHVASVALLLDHGADAGGGNRLALLSAVHVRPGAAVSQEARRRVVRLLVDRGADLAGAVRLADDQDLPEMAMRLLENVAPGQ